MSKGEVRFGLCCQILVQQETHPRSVMQSPETVAQLQQALEQISNISTALSDIQRYYQEQVIKERVMQKQDGYPFSLFISIIISPVFLMFVFR